MKRETHAAWLVPVGLLLLLWYAPLILLQIAHRMIDRARFRLVVALAEALAGLGLKGAARRLYRYEYDRAGRQKDEVSKRMTRRQKPKASSYEDQTG